MGKEKSKERKVKRLEQQVAKFKDNPENVRRLQGKIASLKPKEKKKK
ncbi:MAG: hypothetical protein WC333_02195 [Dehalococcoidia bacterium]|jgi:hypothetical protein